MNFLINLLIQIGVALFGRWLSGKKSTEEKLGAAEKTVEAQAEVLKEVKDAQEVERDTATESLDSLRLQYPQARRDG